MRKKKAVLNITSSLLLQFIVIIYGFIVPKIIITIYGSSINGLVSSITQFLSYIALLDSGFTAVVKSKLYKPLANNDDNTIASILKSAESFFRKIAIVFIFYIILFSIVYPYIADSPLSYISTISLIIIISISMFSEYYFGMTYRLFLEANQENYVISCIQIFTYILSTIIIFILSKCSVSIHIIKLFTGMIFIIRPLLQNIYVKRKYHISFNKNTEKFKLKNKWDGLAQHIASVIHGNTDVAILTIFSTLKEVSVYSVYYMVVTGIKKIVQSFTNGIDSTFGDMLAKNEKNNLLKKFNTYEILYNTISVIAFSCTIILITPFVSIYTNGIEDVNYYRPFFGYLIVISEYIWAIRLPYSSITLAAGHFKETRIGAWIECTTNIIISIILVINYGIIGVAIGTIIAMTIRTIEFVIHTNKYILNRSSLESFKKIGLVIFETILIIFICSILKLYSYTNYSMWFINALFVSSISIAITIVINSIIYKNYLNIIKNILHKVVRKK